jgi:hypothetical protein
MDNEPGIVSIDEFNARVSNYGYDMGQRIRTRISQLTSEGKGDLLRSFKAKMHKHYGEIDRISFRFAQHGVYLHKGVGRGYAMVGGKVMRVSGSVGGMFTKRYASLKNREYKPKILSDLAMKREPVDWFNPVIEASLDGLADLVAEMRADQLVRATNFLTEKEKVIIK